jgi:signal transduction histidine kinase
VLAGLSAEMHAPVKTLLSAANALREELSDERAQTRAADMAGIAAFLLEFVNDLSSLASLESGRLEINSSPLDLPTLLASLHDDVAKHLQDLQVTMDVLAFADLPLLLADEHLVRRMALNLIANALSGIEHGGRITLAAFRLPDGGLGLRVSHSGLGLSEAELEHVLEDFVAGRHDRINAEKPAGISLTIVRALAELHGGSLSIGRRMGVGAYATVHFPPERLMPRRALVRLIEAA